MRQRVVRQLQRLPHRCSSARSRLARNGRKVAFCTNYEQPKVPVLYVKDLSNGRLTPHRGGCPVIDSMVGEHVHQDSRDLGGWPCRARQRGPLVGNGAARPAVDRGQAVLHRNGQDPQGQRLGQHDPQRGHHFLRLGVPKRATPSSTIRVGAYNVNTRKVRNCRPWTTSLGTPVAWFDAYEQASYRGRFVVGMQPVLSEGTSGELLDVRVWWSTAAQGRRPTSARSSGNGATEPRTRGARSSPVTVGWCSYASSHLIPSAPRWSRSPAGNRPHGQPSRRTPRV